MKCSAIHSVNTINIDNEYHKLLEKLSSITKLPDPNQPVKHNTIYFIPPKAAAVVMKSGRLAPDCLKIAKKEFKNVIHLGNLRLSRINYASHGSEK